ncbi:Amidase 1 [Spatholobus suberectus]|nr:Amidase 1 [Spatholobus suberectus]
MKTPSDDTGAFMKKFTLKSCCPTGDLLESLNFAVKDMFDIEGHVASFGNPTWRRNQLVATSTAPTILGLLNEGSTCVGTVITDEMASSILGKNVHYGTPGNPCVPDRVPGGYSSASASVVGAGLVDFALATDCIGSARIPALYCGIFGISPSHGVVSGSGVLPLAQSLDTVEIDFKDDFQLNLYDHFIFVLR